MDEFLNYERYGADGILIDFLCVLDPADWLENLILLSKPLFSL